MAKSWRLAPGLALVLGAAIVGCGKDDRGGGRDEQTTQTRTGALTTSLFQPYVAYATGSHPEAVAIGDLDGDGRQDVAVLTSYNFDAANDDMVHVFLQDTDGTLKPRVKYPVGGVSGSSMDIGDVNGDGRADVVVGLRQATNLIGVLLQNASGTLDAMVPIATVNSYRVKIGDFNGDGRMDIAGINFGGSGDGLDVFLQTETGTLAAPVTYHVPRDGFEDLDAGDIDGDGRTDLVITNGQGFGFPNVNVLLQLPDGTFAASTPYSLGSGLVMRGVALGDTNGDGRTDIVVSYGGNRPNTFIARFLQNAAGGMDPAVSYPSWDFPTAVVMADVDADGRKDVLVAHDSSQKLGVYRQFPSGDFVSEEIYTITGGYKSSPQALAVGDINGDGRPDAVVADSAYGLIVLRHVQDTSLALTVTAPTPTGGPYYVGAPVTVRWTVGDAVPLAGFDLSVAFNGTTYTPIAGCTGLPATATECTWTPAQSGIGTPIRVTARDTAGNTASSQTTFSPVTPYITVTAPYGNQFVGVGTTTNITWSHNLPATGAVRIELSRDGGSTYETLADPAPIGNSNSGSFAWNVTGPTTSTARVRVTYNGPLLAGGTNDFAITTAPTLSISSPSAGATVYTNSVSASWNSNAGWNVGTVRVELSRDGGSTFETLADSIPNTSSFMGAVPGPGSTDARLRVTLTVTGAASVSATSGSFALVEPSVTVNSPAAGALYPIGWTGPITWTSSVPSPIVWSVLVELSRDGGSTYQTLVSYPSNGGSVLWSITGPATNAAQIRVTLTYPGKAPVVGTGGLFTIAAPSVTVTSPTAGATLLTGAPVAITWSSNLPATSSAQVQLSRDGGSTYEYLGSSTTGSLTWVVTGPATSGALFRVTIGNTAATSGTFAIAVPSVTVTGSPGLWYVGAQTAITWSTNLPAAAPVTIELSRNYGSTYEVLATNAPNTGSFAWTVTGPAASPALVRVTVGGTPSASGTAPIAILVPSLTVTSPVAGASYYAGASMTIAWSSTNIPAGSPVTIELSRDGGGTFQTLATNVFNSGSFTDFAPGPSTSSALVRVAVGGTLSLSASSGLFSIVVPSVTVTSPGGGASFYAGTPLAITWSTNLPAAAPVTVELSRDAGGTYAVLATNAPNTGSFAWTVTGPAASNARFRVTVGGTPSTSSVSGLFAIVVPSLTVTSPGAGASFYAGTPLAITWATNLPAASPVTVELSRDGGGTYEVLATNAPNTGSFVAVATGPSTGAALARVTVGGTPSLSASSGLFSIAVPSLTVTSPAAGAALYAGTPLTITWSTNMPGGSPVAIELSRDGGSTFETLAAAAPNTGSFDWIVSGPDSALASVRVTATDPVTVSATSGTFSITTAALSVTGPAAGTLAYAGTPVTITWTSNLPAADPVSIELSRDGGATFTVLNGAVANSGSFVWTATGPDTTQARARVTSHGAVSASGVGADFQILTGTLAVTSPAAGANWAIGTARTISWSNNLPAGTTVRVELSRNSGATWATLSSAASGGSLAWTATGPATSAAIVRVTANGGVPAVGSSAAFTIGNPAVTVTAPAAGASWTIGVAQAITWTSNLLPTATVKIELSRNGGSTYTTLASSAPNTGTFAWTATGPAGTNTKVRVSANGFTASSVSGTFSLVAASVRVTSPNTAVTWTVGTVHAVTWTHNLGASAQFKIEVSRNGVFSTIVSAVTGGGATSGSYNWTVTSPKTTNAKIRVTWTGGSTVTDSSDVSFSIN